MDANDLYKALNMNQPILEKSNEDEEDWEKDSEKGEQMFNSIAKISPDKLEDC